MKSAQYWIKQLKLQPHPEGGYFNETYRCKETLTADNLPERFTQEHCFSTAIYYLLEAPDISAFHRIKQDELWHYYTGNSALTIHVISQAGNYHSLQLGNDPASNQAFQQWVEAGDWFAASVEDPDGYALVGCTVAPGFEFADFEMAQENKLIKLCPEQQTLIKSLSKNP